MFQLFPTMSTHCFQNPRLERKTDKRAGRVLGDQGSEVGLRGIRMRVRVGVSGRHEAPERDRAVPLGN